MQVPLNTEHQKAYPWLCNCSTGARKACGKEARALCKSTESLPETRRSSPRGQRVKRNPWTTSASEEIMANHSGICLPFPTSQDLTSCTLVFPEITLEESRRHCPSSEATAAPAELSAPLPGPGHSRHLVADNQITSSGSKKGAGHHWTNL